MGWTREFPKCYNVPRTKTVKTQLKTFEIYRVEPRIFKQKFWEQNLLILNSLPSASLGRVFPWSRIVVHTDTVSKTKPKKILRKKLKLVKVVTIFTRLLRKFCLPHFLLRLCKTCIMKFDIFHGLCLKHSVSVVTLNQL